MTDQNDYVDVSNEELDMLFTILIQINESIDLLNETLTPGEEVDQIEIEIEEIDPVDTELYQLKELNRQIELSNQQLDELIVIAEIIEPANYEQTYKRQIELLETIDSTMQESKEVIQSQHATQQTYGMFFIPLALITFILYWAFKKFI